MVVMPHRSLTATAMFGTLVLSVWSGTPAVGQIFSITDWSLGVGLDGGFPHIYGESFENVVNPLADSLYIADRASNASTSLNLSWNDTYGEFSIHGSQTCVAQNPPPHPGGVGFEICGASGYLVFNNTSDLLFSADAEYSYNFVGPGLNSNMAFSVADYTVFPDIGYINENFDDFSSVSSGGTFALHHEVVLPAGGTFTVSYSQRLIADYNTGAIATGDGYFHFTIQPVPEPMSFTALTLLVIARRRTRRLS